MRETLIETGLTATQADAYLLLLESSPIAPPELAAKLGLTRSNAYKVLDQLIEMDLATREERHKKLIYSAGDPQALQTLLAKVRNKVIAQEKAVQRSIEALRPRYNQQAAPLEARTYRGAGKLKRLYEEQAAIRQPIHFIKSRADIPTLGYETMDYVRSLPARHGTQRYGITADAAEAPNNPDIDKQSNLTRTWMDESVYNAPVEWSVSGDEVTIFIFEKDGSAVKIKNQAVADSFRQIWQQLDAGLRNGPEYASRPRKANRAV